MKKKRSKHRKKPARNCVRKEVWRGDGWPVVAGRLVPPAGRPPFRAPRHFALCAPRSRPFTANLRSCRGSAPSMHDFGQGMSSGME